MHLVSLNERWIFPPSQCMWCDAVSRVTWCDVSPWRGGGGPLRTGLGAGMRPLHGTRTRTPDRWALGINNCDIGVHHHPHLVRTDKYFVSFSTCNPNTCSHWLTQSQKEADIYYLFIIGWHTLYFSSYWLSFKDLSLLHMSRLRWKLVQVEN